MQIGVEFILDFILTVVAAEMGMGSLPAHIAAILLLLPAGLRRLYSSAAHHLRSPSPSPSQPWYLSPSKPLNLDLYALLLLLPLSSFAYLFLSLSTLRLPLLHHSAILFLFWLLTLLVALRCHLPLPPSLLFLLAAAAFLLDAAAASSVGYSGVAARAYRLLAATTLACAAACLALAASPSVFFADVALSAGVVLKGTWVLQAGLLLFSDAFAPGGCRRMAADGDRDVRCVLEEDRMRAVAMVDLLFVVHVVGVVVVVLGVLWLHRGLGQGNGFASISGQGRSDGVLERSEPEFDFD